MVRSNRALLEASMGPYKLIAVRRGEPPEGGPAGETALHVSFTGTEPAALRVGEQDILVHGECHVPFARPLLGENSEVSVYISGPMASSFSTYPRSDSSNEAYQPLGIQHVDVKYRGAVGDVEWKWITPVGSMVLRLECFPAKLDYRSDFLQIRQALEALSPTLTASVSGSAGAGFGSVSRDSESNVEWLELVRRHHTELRAAMRRLLPSLRRQIEGQVSIRPADRLRRAKPVSRRSYGATLSRRPVSVHSLVTGTATPLNGHLRWEVEQLLGQVTVVRAATWFDDLDENLKAPVDELGEESFGWMMKLAHVPPVRSLPNLQVKLRDPSYQAAFASLRALRDALEPLHDAKPIGLKDLPTLYEYWVFLALVEILKARFPILLSTERPLVQRAGPNLVMTPGRSSEIHLADDDGNEVHCQYNRSFTELPTTSQRPDSVIWIRRGDRLLVVDAKYRLGRDQRYVGRYGMEGPLAEDINVIHRYRDAIVERTSPHRQLSHAGLIAFPGRETNRYRRHRFFQSWLSVGVGGIPMLPSGTALMAQVINEYLEDAMAEETA